MSNQFYNNISCFQELEVKRAICGESNADFLKHCVRVDDCWFCFPTKISTMWFDANGNRVDVKDVTLTKIPKSAFYWNNDLIAFEIPSSVKSIGNLAFYCCRYLTSVTIPDGVVSIGDWVFADCAELTSMTIPSSVMSIGYSTFYNCYSLTSVTIPSSVKSIGNLAFQYCAKLEQIKTSPGNAQRLKTMLVDSSMDMTNVKIIEEDL